MYDCPLFQPLQPWLEQLPPAPDARAVSALAERAGLSTTNGLPLRFVPPQADGFGYEERIWQTGQVETRSDNWHDFFNALVWLAFPQAKAALNARHMAEMSGQPETRGMARDAMTHFDECGLVVISSDAALLDLLRGFRWKALFWERRAEVMAGMEFWVFGHATYEHLLSPFHGLTAKAVLYEAPGGWRAEDETARRTWIDGCLAEDFAAGRYLRPRELQPVPLLGVPGVTMASEVATYYDDQTQFRPGRRQRVAETHTA